MYANIDCVKLQYTPEIQIQTALLWLQAPLGIFLFCGSFLTEFSQLLITGPFIVLPLRAKSELVLADPHQQRTGTGRILNPQPCSQNHPFSIFIGAHSTGEVAESLPCLGSVMGPLHWQ